LQKEYGYPSKFILNTDATFLSILMDALNDRETGIAHTRCSLKLFRKMDVVDSEGVEFGTHFSILMFFLRVKDSIHDRELGMKQKSLTLIRGLREEKALDRLCRMGFEISTYRTYLKEQFRVEKENLDFPGYSAPTEKFLAYIFSFILEKSGSFTEDGSLVDIGTHLGRLMYLYDNLHDLQVDIRKGNFNPFSRKSNAEIQFLAEDILGESLSVIDRNLRGIRYTDSMHEALLRELLVTDLNMSFRRLFEIFGKKGYTGQPGRTPFRKPFAMDSTASLGDQRRSNVSGPTNCRELCGCCCNSWNC